MGEYRGAGLAPVDLAIVAGFLVLVTVIGWLLSRAASGGLEDYFLGGRKIPWWVLGISTATSNFDMAGTMIVVAMVYSLGYRGFLVEIRGGVGLSLAFLLVFLGKWLRRSRVMTSAEWMKIRFGTGKPGRAAHLLSAVANIALSLGMIIYFSKGSGKFLTLFLPLGETASTALMVSVGLFYTLLSGLYGVVFTDVVQMVLLGFTSIYVTVVAYDLAPRVALPDGLLDFTLASPGALADDLVRRDPQTWGPIVSAFALCVLFWVLRTTLEGSGGVGGYTDQRFFAARSERDAGLISLQSILLSGLRWTMVAGLVVMGHHLVAQGGHAGQAIVADPENTLPVVLAELLPVGVKGFVVAGLIAAAMSTFDSTLNVGASYIVRDIYQSYLRPDADDRRLIWVSRWATVGLCVAGVGLAAVVPNINRIWGLITMGLGAGLFVPLFLRWYWPRFNGWGFAAGTGAGLIAGLIFQGALAWPLYWAFPSVVLTALAVSLVATFLTEPVEADRLARFALQVNPFGPWGTHEARAEQLGLMSSAERVERRAERRRDLMALCAAVPAQVALLVGGMALVFRDGRTLAVSAAVFAVGAVLLYFLWFRHLKPEAKCREEDERFDRLSETGRAAPGAPR